jgi:SOS-response transcriptional repressor LexA
MIKYTSNALLAAKISFANEIGNLCKKIGVDVYEVMKGVGMDSRVSPKFLNAGAGFGGSCFPKDVAALADIIRKEDLEPIFLDAILKVNNQQPLRMVALLEDKIGSLSRKRIAVLGQTACGNPIEAISYADEFIETNELKATFALRAVGDSMAPIINDGDVVLVKQTEELEIGDIGIFQINETGFSDDEEVTCKVLKSIKDGVMTLAPLNAAYDPIMVDAKTNQVKVIGKYLGRA